MWTDISPKAVSFTGEPGNGPFAQGIALDPCNRGVLYLSVQDFPVSPNVGLYKSIDAGGSWSKIGSLDEPIRIRVDPKNSQHLYAGDGVRGHTMGFWISSDGGATWSMPPGYATAQAARGTSFADVYDVAVDPADFSHVLVAFHSGFEGIVESHDAGNSWSVREPGPGWGFGHGVWFLKSSSSWLVGTQDAGYWRTADSGVHWSQVTMLNMAHGGGQLYRTRAGALYGTSTSGVMRSLDDGLTWLKVGSVSFVTSVFGDGRTLYTHEAYAGGKDSFYASPEDDGLVWTPYNGGTSQFSDGPFEMVFDDVNGIIYSANWGNGLLALKVIL